MPSYNQAFAYIAPHVSHREAFLNDDHEGNSSNKYHWDFVSIFLNLSAIPTDCIKNLKISDEDYSTNLNQ